MDRFRVWAAALYGALVVTHLIAQLADAADLAQVTQWVAMPLLVVAFLAQRPPSGRRTRFVLVALFFSWLGDALPDFFTGDPAFLVMVAAFLFAQIAYIASFLPHWRDSYLRSPWLLAYAAAIGVLVYFCAPHAGNLLVPVLIYGAALGTMAVLASGFNGMTTAGGALFLLSDGLIAVGAFATDISLPMADFWIMLTYLVGQGLLAYGVAHRRARLKGVDHPRHSVG
ncbi:lysoplasmalogenase [Cumulibacter soli]|uniref:lysoplasmalogenase n=1 Tax=Cumulibacter soli TaxID=2546344 RepID=UPI0010672292|nr:lysoplasmalogenase [Cumulibacter soli]